MIATPILLVKPAEQAGFNVPKDPTQWNEKDPMYLRWTIFCNVQIGQSLPYPAAHWDNAMVIAKIPTDELKTITLEELIAKGFKTGTALP